MASRMERRKAAREYGRLERVAPSPALQLADNELASELYPYLKNNSFDTKTALAEEQSKKIYKK